METGRGGPAWWDLCRHQHSAHPPASPTQASPSLNHQTNLRGPEIFLILKTGDYGLLIMSPLIDEVRNGGIRKKTQNNNRGKVISTVLKTRLWFKPRVPLGAKAKTRAEVYYKIQPTQRRERFSRQRGSDLHVNPEPGSGEGRTCS